MCFKTRRPPAITVSVFSGIVFILGIVIMALAIQFTIGATWWNTTGSDGNAADVNVEKFKNTSFGILVSAGIIAFITGIYGMFFTCCVNKCYAILFGTFLGFTWIAMLVMGSIVTAVSNASQSNIQAFCDGTLTGTNGKFAAQISDAIAQMDSSVNGYLNTYMCSTNCPCDSSVSAGWGNFTELQLNGFGRTA